jgi:hypothetical protein
MGEVCGARKKPMDGWIGIKISRLGGRGVGGAGEGTVEGEGGKKKGQFPMCFGAHEFQAPGRVIN